MGFDSVDYGERKLVLWVFGVKLARIVESSKQPKDVIPVIVSKEPIDFVERPNKSRNVAERRIL